jgi:hypothetical protein
LTKDKSMETKNYSRRNFIAGSLAIGSGVFLPSYAFGQQERPTAIDPKIVNEFVKVAHNNLDRVKELLAERPLLLNASWDWGNGDFETAIGAAGHMGLKDYANFLIEKGARLDIFVLTMLGKTSIVKPIIEAYPNLLESHGPHGFTLLHHAKQGGKDGEELVEYFSSKGLKDLHRKVFK